MAVAIVEGNSLTKSIEACTSRLEESLLVPPEFAKGWFWEDASANCPHDEQKHQESITSDSTTAWTCGNKTAWLEKNSLLYTQKRQQLESLTKERGLTCGEVTLKEQKLIKHVALYESRRSGMWNLAKEINDQEQNLKPITSSEQIFVNDSKAY